MNLQQFQEQETNKKKNPYMMDTGYQNQHQQGNLAAQQQQQHEQYQNANDFTDFNQNKNNQNNNNKTIKNVLIIIGACLFLLLALVVANEYRQNPEKEEKINEPIAIQNYSSCEVKAQQQLNLLRRDLLKQINNVTELDTVFLKFLEDNQQFDDTTELYIKIQDIFSMLKNAYDPDQLSEFIKKLQFYLDMKNSLFLNIILTYNISDTIARISKIQAFKTKSLQSLKKSIANDFKNIQLLKSTQNNLVHDKENVIENIESRYTTLVLKIINKTQELVNKNFEKERLIYENKLRLKNDTILQTQPSKEVQYEYKELNYNNEVEFNLNYDTIYSQQEAKNQQIIKMSEYFGQVSTIASDMHHEITDIYLKIFEQIFMRVLIEQNQRLIQMTQDTSDSRKSLGSDEQDPYQQKIESLQNKINKFEEQIIRIDKIIQDKLESLRNFQNELKKKVEVGKQKYSDDEHFNQFCRIAVAQLVSEKYIDKEKYEEEIKKKTIEEISKKYHKNGDAYNQNDKEHLYDFLQIEFTNFQISGKYTTVTQILKDKSSILTEIGSFIQYVQNLKIDKHVKQHFHLTMDVPNLQGQGISQTLNFGTLLKDYQIVSSVETSLEQETTEEIQLLQKEIKQIEEELHQLIQDDWESPKLEELKNIVKSINELQYNIEEKKIFINTRLPYFNQVITELQQIQKILHSLNEHIWDKEFSIQLDSIRQLTQNFYKKGCEFDFEKENSCNAFTCKNFPIQMNQK